MSWWPFLNELEAPPLHGGACCRCGAAENPHGGWVTWKCAHCNGYVCVGCTQRVKGNPSEILEETFCSPECLEAEKIRRRMLGQPEPEE